MTVAAMKKAVGAILRELPEEATWEDLQYRIYVRQSIEKGRADADAGRVHPHAEVRARFGLE